MQSSKGLSVIIVNYKSESYLERCIASLYNQFDPDELEIIVVNNDEQEDLERLADKFSEINIVKFRKNLGFGTANNVGAREAKGKYLFILNPDTEILSANFREILNKFEKNVEVAVIGPRLLTNNRETQLWCAGKEFSLWQLFRNNFGTSESKKVWESQNDTFSDWVSGAALIVKKEMFEKVGGFDENFFMYFEDEDLCKRIRREGYGVLYSPEFCVLHHGGKSRESLLKQKKQYFTSMFYWFWKKIRNV